MASMAKYITITLFAYAINLFMGILVAKSKRLIIKLVYIHLPVPIMLTLRKTWQLEESFLVVIIIFAILGLLSGQYIYNHPYQRAVSGKKKR